MAKKNPVCVQCGVDRKTIRAEQYICATVAESTESGAGEVDAEWPRHRFKPYSEKDLAQRAADEAEYIKHMGEFADFVNAQQVTKSGDEG